MIITRLWLRYRETLVHTTQMAAAYYITTSRCVASCFNSSKSIKSNSDKLSSFSEDAEKKRMERGEQEWGWGKEAILCRTVSGTTPRTHETAMSQESSHSFLISLYFTYWNKLCCTAVSD